MSQPQISKNTVDFEDLIELYKTKCHKDLFFTFHKELKFILKK